MSRRRCCCEVECEHELNLSLSTSGTTLASAWTATGDGTITVSGIGRINVDQSDSSVTTLHHPAAQSYGSEAFAVRFRARSLSDSGTAKVAIENGDNLFEIDLNNRTATLNATTVNIGPVDDPESDWTDILINFNPERVRGEAGCDTVETTAGLFVRDIVGYTIAPVIDTNAPAYSHDWKIKVTGGASLGDVEMYNTSFGCDHQSLFEWSMEVGCTQIVQNPVGSHISYPYVKGFGELDMIVGGQDLTNAVPFAGLSKIWIPGPAVAAPGGFGPDSEGGIYGYNQDPIDGYLTSDRDQDPLRPGTYFFRRGYKVSSPDPRAGIYPHACREDNWSQFRNAPYDIREQFQLRSYTGVRFPEPTTEAPYPMPQHQICLAGSKTGHSNIFSGIVGGFTFLERDLGESDSPFTMQVAFGVMSAPYSGTFGTNASTVTWNYP